MRLKILYVAAACGLCVSAAAVFAANKPKPKDDAAFKSAAALGAKARFENKLVALETDYQRKAAAARNEYVDALERAMADATRKADLDEAVRIRDTINELVRQRGPARPGAAAGGLGTDRLAAKLLKTTWGDDGPKQKGFGPDGKVLTEAGDVIGRWYAVEGDTVVIVYNDEVKYVDVLRFNETVNAAKVRGFTWQGTADWRPVK